MQHHRHIYAAVHRILLRDEADLPPWLPTFSAPLYGDSLTTNRCGACAAPGPLAPQPTPAPAPAAENPARRPS